MRFLVDECLSVHLATVARQAGHEARHVAHIGRAGWKDWNVLRYTRDGDFTFVNASDFRRLYAARSRRTQAMGFVSADPAQSRIGASDRAFPSAKFWRSSTHGFQKSTLPTGCHVGSPGQTLATGFATAFPT